MRKQAALFILVVILIAFGISCSNSKRTEGAKIIEKIEKFKTHENRLPKSLTEIGIADSEEGPVYYKQIGDSHYQLWYGAALGESVIYDSDRKTWK
jgi:hypothetical protein